jgi:hypothetical protein
MFKTWSQRGGVNTHNDVIAYVSVYQSTYMHDQSTYIHDYLILQEYPTQVRIAMETAFNRRGGARRVCSGYEKIDMTSY